jgi:hypothetical protein
MGALSRFVDKHFGVKTRAVVNPVVGAVGIGVTKIANNNPDRLALVVMNISDTDMYAAPDPTPSATHGLLLQNGGGAMSLQADADGELVGYEWNIYCAGAAKAIFVLSTGAE